MSTPRIGPLSAAQPIVDGEGRPTPFFIRQWLEARNVTVTVGDVEISLGELQETVSGLDESVQVLLAREIIAGVGLSGGGTLGDGDVTLALEAVLDTLQDVDTVTTPPTDGQTLLFDDADSLWKPGTVSGGGGLSVVNHTVLNGGAEAGDTSNWTDIVGGLDVRSSNPAPFEGSFYFSGGPNEVTFAEQVITLDSSTHTAIDAGRAQALLAWAQTSFDGDDMGEVRFRFEDGSGSEIIRTFGTPSAMNGNQIWMQRTLFESIPPLTRKVSIGLIMRRVSGTNNDSYMDDIGPLKVVF